MTWEETTFESIYAEPSRNGVYKPQEFRGSGYKMVNMGELFAHDFINSQPMDRIQLTAAEIAKNQLLEGDLLFGRRSLIEEGAGKCSLVTELDEPTTFESSLIRVRLDKCRVRPRFFFYYFSSPVGRARVKAIVTGTNVKGIRASVLKTIKVHLPPLPEQEKISEALSVYDDLLENNRRRIELLERAAHMLYKEWFVHLRFPGYKHVRVEDGVPDGWERKTTNDVMSILSGGTPKTSTADYWNGKIPFFTPKDTTDTPFALTTEKYLTEQGLRSCNSKLFAENTLFITARGTVGKLQLAQAPMAMNQSCYALIAKEPLNQHFLYCAMQDAIEQLRSRAVGSVFNAIVVDTFRQIPFMTPSEDLIRHFSNYITPMFDQIKNLVTQSQKFEQARDLLLPRLMRGELQI